MAVLIFVLTALSVLATMTALAMERRVDVGLMKALGGSIGRIVSLFLAEVSVLGVGWRSDWIFDWGFVDGLDWASRVWGGDFASGGSFAFDCGFDGGRGVGWGAAFAFIGAGEACCDFARRMMAPLVQVDGLTKQFGDVRAIDALSFEVEAGEWIAIMGPSGSGKTTLINILGGLDTPTSGRAMVEDVDVARFDEGGLTRYRADKVGFIFQQFHLVPYLTAVENVMLAQYFHSTTDEGEAREALKRVGLADRVEHLPSQLSGGEQQRVAVARALINHPKIFWRMSLPGIWMRRMSGW